MKHKWDKEIRAYLDGKEVEMYYPDVKEWKQVLCMNKFDCKFDIRIKPEPKPDVVLYAYSSDYIGTTHIRLATKAEANLELIYDGDTLKLIGSQVIK